MLLKMNFVKKKISEKAPLENGYKLKNPNIEK